MTPKNYNFRHQLLKSTRQFFDSQKFTEVEVQILNSTLPLEQNIYSINTLWTHKQTKYYLPTSPELALKAALSAGLEDCFAIGKCFRDLEDSNKYHTPEFTMLEWYQLGQNYHQTANKVQEFISYIYHGLGIDLIQRTDFILKDLFRLYAGIDLTSYLNSPQFNESDFNQLFLNKIEPHLPADKLVFIFDYPSTLSPLAQPISGTPYAARFEAYLNGIEIANGCTENLDPVSIRRAFNAETEYRTHNDLPAHPWDQKTINLLTKIPPCSGVGFGFDRLEKILFDLV